MEHSLFDDFAHGPLRLCPDGLDNLGLSVLCPLSPNISDAHLFSPLSGSGVHSADDSHDDLLSSPSLGASLHGSAHEASSYFQESTVSGRQRSGSLYTLSSSGEEELSTGGLSPHLTDDSASNRSTKRTKLEWTPELHARFVEAVESLPPEKQVPSRILESMGDWGVGLTRANIASHLQKYRNRRRSPSTSQLDTAAAACPPHVPAAAAAAAAAASAPLPSGVVLGVPCFHLMHPGAALPFAAAPHHASAWPPAAALPALASARAELSPAPAPAPIHAPAPAADWTALLLEIPEEPLPAELAVELQEVLAGKRKRGPLGLQLDCAAVARQWNGR